MKLKKSVSRQGRGTAKSGASCSPRFHLRRIFLVLRTGYKVDNPFYYAKQKSNNPIQSSPAINPAESAATFRMSFFESRNFSLEIVFWIFFSGHIINRLVISSNEKSRRKNRKKCLRVKCELESSCFSNSLFSTIVLVVIRYKPASNANICVILMLSNHYDYVLDRITKR